MNDKGEELASDLAVAVVRFARYLRVRRRESSTLSLTQLSAMTTLHREGPLTPGALAAFERVTPPSMTRVIAALTDAGMLTRDPHPTDRRNLIVSLTPLGVTTMVDEDRARQHGLARRWRICRRTNKEHCVARQQCSKPFLPPAIHTYPGNATPTVSIGFNSAARYRSYSVTNQCRVAYARCESAERRETNECDL